MMMEIVCNENLFYVIDQVNPVYCNKIHFHFLVFLAFPPRHGSYCTIPRIISTILKRALIGQSHSMLYCRFVRRAMRIFGNSVLNREAALKAEDHFLS